MLPVLSLDAVTVLGRGAIKDLEGSFSKHSLAVIVTGSPSAVTVELEASNDGVRFFNIGEVTGGSGVVTVDEHLWRYVTANVDTLTGGTSPTVTAWVASS